MSVGPETHAMTNEAPPTPQRPFLRNPYVMAGAAVLIVLVIVGGILWWLHARQYESTDDAFIDAHIVRLAPQLAGQVMTVLVDDNQRVQQGQTLVLINSAAAVASVAAAQAAGAQAAAQDTNAHAEVRVADATLQQARAQLAAATAAARIGRLDFERFQSLAALNTAAVAKQQLDQAQATADQGAAEQDAAQRAVEVRIQMRNASQALVIAAAAQARIAAAQLSTAAISLGYAQIAAPLSGHVAEMSVAVGAYVQPGTELLAIVPDNLWVTANFKETQLTFMRAGQAVTIRVDACPDVSIHGHVDSIERGAGQAFAILPPENATGNYVKVVQRVPVKILMDRVPKRCLLGPGMSVEPQVHVR